MTDFKSWKAAYCEILSRLYDKQWALDRGWPCDDPQTLETVKEKVRVYDGLLRLANLCISAKDLLNIIEGRSFPLSPKAEKLFSSAFAKKPIDDLQKIVDAEKAGVKTYYVTYAVTGRFIAKVEASSVEEARKAALDKYYDADFRELEDIDGEDIMVEDEDGNYVWER